MNIAGRLIALCLLFILSALFSATETAFTSLSFLQLSKLAEQGRRGRVLKKLHAKSDNLLTTILLGNNLVNIAATALATELTLLFFPKMPVIATTFLLTYLILVFSELTPKRIAFANNEWISVHLVYFVWFWYYSLLPFIYLVRYSSWLISFPFARKKAEGVSEEGIIQMVNLGTQAGVVENYEGRLVHNIFLLNDLTVESIMTRRQEVFSIEENTSIEAAIELIIAHRFSRIPIFENEAENITGLILAKEITTAFLEGKRTEAVKQWIHHPPFISEAKKVSELFGFFKSHNLKMAVVLDEYSGLAGIVTQEDVIEAIMGQLNDENESPETEMIQQTGVNRWEVSGETPVFQLNDTLGIGIPLSRNFKTVAGFLMEHWDEIPTEGMRHQYGSYQFKIAQMEHLKIVKIELTKTDGTAAEHSHPMPTAETAP